jgi:hypothetical protein
VVSYRRKDSATNRVTFTAQAVRTLDRNRHAGEAVSKVWQRQLRFEACQGGCTRSWKAQAPAQEGVHPQPIAVCLVAYLVVERERLNCGDTWRQRERQLILRGGQAVLPALERVRSAA